MESFNPRAHAGRDKKSVQIKRVCKSFNPRAHAGRDAYDNQR